VARIAFAGLGRMGLPMCTRLAGAGFDVAATDLRRELRDDVLDIGARWAPSITDAAADADFLITMLPGPDEVAAVIPEATACLAPGSCWIDMSSASPPVARAIAGAAGPRGLSVVDGPVGGGPEAAATGRLLVFAGGEDSSVGRCATVLDALAQRVLHVGPGGSGYAVKLLVNALWFTQAVAGAEVLTLGRRAGLDLDVLLGALNQSAAASRFFAEDASALLDGDDKTTFALSRCCEELSSVLSLGSELEVPLDVFSAVTGVHLSALERYGDVDGELLGARLVAERSGVELGHS
jgi:3-hydroxyisobutyrate dehydrogenase-like beta-hydroxyacid dehydrogenase